MGIKKYYKMNWYKKSQQEVFNFYKTMPQSQPRSIEESPEYKSLDIRSQSVFQELLDDIHGRNDLMRLLKMYSLKWKQIDFPEETLITIVLGSNLYIIDDLENPTLKEAKEWLWDTSNYGRLDNYIPPEDFSKTFWDNLGNNSVVYHATTEENKESILRNGLGVRDKTRGINNRSTGAAIFTSDNPDDVSSYGDVIFTINLSKMKKDGYMPEVSREGPVEEAERLEALAYKIGVEDFIATESNDSEGLYPSTIIIYGDVPKKYLSLYNQE